LTYIKPKTRIKTYANAPIRSGSGYQVGFYDIGLLRQALDHSGESFYRIGALAIPTNETEFTQVQRIINDPTIQYALVDKDKIVICQIGENKEWLSIINDMGYVVEGGGKTPKRLKTSHRPALINAHFELDEINVVTVDCAQYSRYFEWSEDGSEFWLTDAEDYLEEYQDPEVWDRLLDGGFVIHPRLIEKGIDNIPIFEMTDTEDPGEYYLNPTLRQDLINDLRHKYKVFNARLIGPDGMLKGNAFVSDKLPEGVDILTWHGNVKTEFKYTKGYRFLAEPQGPKSKVRTDDQTLINMPQLFTKANMEYWLTEEYEKMFADAINDRLLMNWRSVYMRSFRDKNKSKSKKTTDDFDIDEQESFARLLYVGYRWKAMNMKITDSPWLFKTLATTHAKPLKEAIPIPCAVSEQIISESMARMIGYDMEIEEGTIQRINDLSIHVVNDLDWLEMYESHGGHDHDDFFSIFYRTMIGGRYDNDKVVVVKRSPNGLGEYSIFKYVEGQWYPTWKTSDGTELSFLEVSGRGWPMRLSTAIRAKKVSYVGLPSTMKAKPPRSATYTRQDVFDDIRASMKGGGVGGFVNATMLYASVFHNHRPVQLCSLEDAIDGCTQTYDSADRDAIEEETKVMVREVIESGLPVDRALWDSKHFSYYLEKGEWVEKYEGKITQLNTITKTKYAEYTQRVHAWAQENARPNDLVFAMGKRLSLHATPILNEFRKDTFNANSMMTTEHGGQIGRYGWDMLYQSVVDQIESYENESDQHDLILGLYVATLTKPTSSGVINDQIIMNKMVFPYLEKALQYYGLANTVSHIWNQDGTIRVVQSRTDQWRCEDEEGNYLIFDDAREYQRYRGRLSPISFTSKSA